MKKRLYLFCNKGYGQAYLDKLFSCSEQLQGFDLHVVFSTKKARQGCWRPFLRALLHSSEQFLTSLPGSGKPLLSWIPDVNAPCFYQSVPAGSIGFIAGFDQIFRPPLLSRFTSLTNFHPSILPWYRGAIPSYWAIVNGESTTGVTAHRVTEEVDGGEIIYQELVDINPGITESELDRKIAAAGSFYFHECLQAMMQDKPFRRNRVSCPYVCRIDRISAHRRGTAPG